MEKLLFPVIATIILVLSINVQVEGNAAVFQFPKFEAVTIITSVLLSQHLSSAITCKSANWYSRLDKPGWSTCPSSNNVYLKGFFRSAKNKNDKIHRLERGKCCQAGHGYANQSATCRNQNWKKTLNEFNVWALCPTGYYLNGIRIGQLVGSISTFLYEIEEAKCCRPHNHPEAYEDCYNENVSISFDNRGWSECKRDGYYMAGFYKSSCNYLHCLEEFKCCKLMKNDGPVCPKEKLQGVTWTETARGKTNMRPCPAGSRGTASRKCSEEGQWNKANFSGCISVEFRKLYDEMEAIIEGRQSELNSQQVLLQLAKVSQPVKNNSLRPLQIYAQDLIIAVDILVKLAEYNDNTANVSSKEDFKNFAQVASNLLESTNRKTWKGLDKAGQGRSQILVKAMDNYGLGVTATLDESSNPRTAETRNLAMRTDRVGQNSLVRVKGLKVAYKKSSITLPPQAFQSSQNFSIVTVVYLTLNDVLSLAKKTGDKNGRPLTASTTIVSSTVYPKPPDVLNGPVEVVLQNIKVSIQSVANQQAECVFWRPSESAIWNSSGCKLVPGKSNVAMTTCECDHLTIFGALMDPYGLPVSKALEIISIIGCSISLISVVITMAVTLFFWKTLKTAKTKVLLNLCAAIAITCTLVIFEGLARNKAGCPVVAALLHFFLLALFSWMLCEGLLLYIKIMEPHKANSFLGDKIQYFYLFGWGFPAIVVAISLAVTQTNGYGNKDVCWLDAKSGLIWAFIGPALLVILINMVVFVLVIRKTVRRKGPGKGNKEQLVKVRAGVKASVILFPLLGITWLFGLLSFSSDTIAFKYLFAIFNSLQGLMIFILHFVRDDEVKKTIQRWLQKQRNAHDFQNEVKERQKSRVKSRKQNDDEQLKQTEEESHKILPKINPSPRTENNTSNLENLLPHSE